MRDVYILLIAGVSASMISTGLMLNGMSSEGDVGSGVGVGLWLAAILTMALGD
jgi:hypothetical protein